MRKNLGSQPGSIGAKKHPLSLLYVGATVNFISVQSVSSSELQEIILKTTTPIKQIIIRISVQ